MNWDAIAAIGQMLGSVAVFITLVYLSVQTRHARSESRRAVSQNRAEANRETSSRMMDERLASIFTKSMIALRIAPGPAVAALMDRAKLTQEEAFSLAIFSRMQWGQITASIPYVDELSAIERHHFDDLIRSVYGANRGPSRIFYETIAKSSAHPDAVRYVENVLAQPAEGTR